MAKARLRHLHLLVAIGDLKSLQKAAQSVDMSQPAATHALAELESLLETELFERHARGMRPTALGQIVIALARNALRPMQACAEAVASSRQGAKALLRIGAAQAAISGLLSHALPSFSDAHPEIVVNVTELGNDGLAALTDERGLDVVLVRAVDDLPSGFEFVPLIEDRYVVVCGTDHPLARRRAVAPSALERWAWLMPPATAIASRDFHRQLDALGIAPAMCWVGSRSVLVALAMLRARPLLAFVPYNVVRQLVEVGLLAIVHCDVHVTLPPIGAAFHTERSRAEPALGSFVAHLAAKEPATRALRRANS